MRALLGGLLLAGLLAGAALAQDADRRVQVVNDSGATLTRLYVSNPDRAAWEEDILGQNVLTSGQSVTINADDGSGACVFDVKAIFDDGTEVIQSGVNICAITAFSLGGERGVPMCPGDARCRKKKP